MNRIKLLILSLIIITLLPFSVLAQKTVRVREYRRKDGTVVKSHERRAPRSSSPTTPTVGYDPAKVFQPSPLDELARLVFEPYEVIDLGDSSTYTPGGTGIVRPRRAVPRVPSKLNSTERYYRQSLLDEVVNTQRRYDASAEILNLFLATPLQKRLPEPGFSDLVSQQRVEAAHYADALEQARRDLLAFDQLLSDVTTRKVFNQRRKRQ